MQPFDVDELLATARSSTCLADFGPPDFLEGLTLLVDSVNRKGAVAESRRGELRRYFLRLLTNRLWFARDLAEHPEIRDEEIDSPVIITSPPRTGSTKLQRILAATGDFQSVSLWRAHMFARIPGLPNDGIEERIRVTQQYEDWMYATSPNILTGHPEFTHEAAEDNLLCEFTFRHPHTFGLLDAPEFSAWIQSADMQPMYDYFHLQLKYLQWQTKPATKKSWVLKTPCHFGNEHYMCKTFSNPRFVVTHRDPSTYIPSVTPTTAAYRKLYSDIDNMLSFGIEGTRYFANCAFDHIKWRDANPEVPVLDLSFNDVTFTGTEAARKVYDFCGMAFSEQAADAIRAWEHANDRDKYGKREYSAEAMGTTDAEIRRVFQPYIDRFPGVMAPDSTS